VKIWTPVIFLALLLAGCGGTQAEQDSQSQKTSQDSGTATARTEETNQGPPGPHTTLTIDASRGKKVEVRVEVADDLFERARGLMYRTALGVNRGMLFVYPEEQKLSFWMRNTLIPLSIAFIDSELRIVDIQDMRPLDDEPPSYVSSGPAQYALEVNQGFFEERGVKVGDRVELPEK
jgi:uncharacterized membrane protein (UPF0127 family)